MGRAPRSRSQRAHVPGTPVGATTDTRPSRNIAQFTSTEQRRVPVRLQPFPFGTGFQTRRYHVARLPTAYPPPLFRPGGPRPWIGRGQRARLRLRLRPAPSTPSRRGRALRRVVHVFVHGDDPRVAEARWAKGWATWTGCPIAGTEPSDRLWDRMREEAVSRRARLRYQPDSVDPSRRGFDQGDSTPGPVACLPIPGGCAYGCRLDLIRDSLVFLNVGQRCHSIQVRCRQGIFRMSV